MIWRKRNGCSTSFRGSYLKEQRLLRSRGDLFDSDEDGDCLDFGKAPYFFCGGCQEGQEYDKKYRSKANPNKEKA